MADNVTDDDMRALSNVLGAQYAVVHMPQLSGGGWCSDDELAAVRVDDTGIYVHTTGPLPADTAADLAAALTAVAVDAFTARR
ncbi:hypothetical protein I1A62_29860 [Rhodococcus sp. USK10]|uniref:hypothetical protein n=1 Tax=Rhodococcus sp. USK10 TaxID=2789739 RepID=UPI001C5E8DC3|nr:hypothetical protein [Rhodococcus sp. USK10]QYB01441.1 hypothetical protein I1A62_29860 [Rhodococcus sp. USK10]